MAFALDSLWRGTSLVLSNAKCSNLSQRGAKPAQARNGINVGGDPELVEGEEAVYAGFDLEQA